MINKSNLPELQEIFTTHSWAKNNITRTTKQFCNDNDIPYNDSLRRKVSSLFEKYLELDETSQAQMNNKILIYDIETTLVRAKLFWTGKQYVNHKSLIDEPKIITISYKWLGDNEVYSIKWDNKNKCDKELVKEFAKIYSSANMVIGQNNGRFDDRFVTARAMKYNIPINVYVKSYDIMKKAKRMFRIPSYSMDYLSKYLEIDGKFDYKREYPGVSMWETIQYGEQEESDKALDVMAKYNDQDVITTEMMYMRLRKYFTTEIHVGVMNECESYSCPTCGGNNVNLYKTLVTRMGTIQRVMICKDDETQFKLSNRKFMDYVKNNYEG
jgi:uncharacterized protein YprB with RNaseH-like and TPR domain